MRRGAVRKVEKPAAITPDLIKTDLLCLILAELAQRKLPLSRGWLRAAAIARLQRERRRVEYCVCAISAEQRFMHYLPPPRGVATRNNYYTLAGWLAGCEVENSMPRQRGALIRRDSQRKTHLQHTEKE
jgi:hypothetical protein